MKYGQTWWGAQWLNALDNIDYANRLPRGRTYANKGAVREIAVADKVSAAVQGSRHQPYHVTLCLEAFTPQQKQQVLNTIVGTRPLLLSRLLNRQLPEQLLPLLTEAGIQLFPTHWQDLDCHCSCPDWAVPCKHIAAVVYLIANEIDKNPFLLFELHGFDLLQAVEASTGTSLATLTRPARQSARWSLEPQQDYWQQASESKLNTLDLSLIPELGARSFSILSDQTLFHPKSFHPVLISLYKRASREARLFEQDNRGCWDSAEQINDLYVIINDAGQLLRLETESGPLSTDTLLSGTGLSAETNPLPMSDTRNRGETQLLQLLSAIDYSQYPRLCPQLLLWHQLYRLAHKLVCQQAMVPALTMAAEDSALILWRPAPFSEAIEKLLQAIDLLCPPDLLVMEISTPQQPRPDTHYACGREQILAALHLLIGAFMRLGLEKAPLAQQQDPICQLFCNGSAETFNRFENHAYPQVIQHWLTPLYLSQRPHRISLWVEEQPQGLSLDIRVERDGLPQPIRPLSEMAEVSTDQLSLLADLALLIDYFPAAEQLLNPELPSRLDYSLTEFTPLLRTVLPALRALGIAIHLPKGLHNLATPELSLKLSGEDPGSSLSYLNLEQLLQFDWQIALGTERLSIEDFRQLLRNSDGLVRLHDQYLMLDEEQVQQLLRRLERLPQSLTAHELLRAGLGGELDGALTDLNSPARDLLQRLQQPEAIALPQGLQATLRPYQQRGFEWLVQNAQLGFGSLLADDMGLGKTLQVICLVLYLKQTAQLEKQQVLVVAPTSLLTNWQKEIQRFAPALNCHTYHGNQRQPADASHDIVLTSYGLVRSDSASLGKTRWRALILDEAQNIKNPSSQQSKAIKKLKSDIRIAMTGTPVENHLREYWSLFDFTNKGYLGTQKQFQQRLAAPIEQERDQAKLAQFRQITAPFILRRLKTDKQIISDLPEKLQSNRYCSLSPSQAALYQSTVDSIMRELQDSSEDIERRGIIFKLLNALKQICNSPAQYLGHSSAVAEESGKLAAFLEIMHEAGEAGEKVLIFTQYRQMGLLLCQQLNAETGMETPFLHGGLSRAERDQMVQRFQTDRHTRAMVLSLKAGGTGLNLTAASQVIHYDLWWNPAVEAQATDRAFRIGQNKRVLVHRLITENSFEEKIDAMIQNKKELAELSVSSGEQWITELSDDQLRALVSL